MAAFVCCLLPFLSLGCETVLKGELVRKAHLNQKACRMGSVTTFMLLTRLTVFLLYEFQLAHGWRLHSSRNTLVLKFKPSSIRSDDVRCCIIAKWYEDVNRCNIILATLRCEGKLHQIKDEILKFAKTYSQFTAVVSTVASQTGAFLCGVLFSLCSYGFSLWEWMLKVEPDNHEAHSTSATTAWKMIVWLLF